MGLAIAIIFTWKILRAPGGYQRRQRRQHRHLPRAGVSGVSPQSSPVIPSTGVFSYSDESKAQDVIDELFHPAKVFVVFGFFNQATAPFGTNFHFFPLVLQPTLAQSVRQKLNEGRKVLLHPLSFSVCSHFIVVRCRSSISCNTVVMVAVLHFFQFLL